MGILTVQWGSLLLGQGETSSDNSASPTTVTEVTVVGGSVTAGPGMAPLSALTLTELRNTSSNHGYIQGSGRVETSSMTSTTRTHGPTGALPSPAGRAVRSPQPERGAAAAGADRHTGLASAALRPGVPAAVRGGGPAPRAAAVAGEVRDAGLIARVLLPGGGKHDLRHAHPPASARRARPAGVRPAGEEPLAAGQRAVAPAHPQRPGYARRGETLGATG